MLRKVVSLVSLLSELAKDYVHYLVSTALSLLASADLVQRCKGEV